MTPRRSVLALAVLVALATVLDLGHFGPAFTFHGDHERDLRMTERLLAGDWPDTTPAVAPLPFELGPLAYLVLAPALAVTADPRLIRAYVALLAGAGALLLLVTLGRRVRLDAALLAGFGLLASAFWFEVTSQLWHSSLLILPVAAWLTMAERWLSGRGEPVRCALGLSALAALSVQLHLTAAVYPLLTLGLLVLRRRELGWRGLGASVGVGLLVLTPLLVTLGRSLSRGALVTAGSAGRGWSPASPLEVLSFVRENVHILWGDVLGPALSDGLLALAVLGGVVAVRSKDLWSRLLLANVALGLLVEWLLLGNQLAHRYLHANFLALSALVAVGAHAALSWLPGRVTAARTLAATTLVLVAVWLEAWLSHVPHPRHLGWLTADQQLAVASTVAERFPMPLDEAPWRIHGLYVSESMGIGWMHRLARRAALPPFHATAHLAVLPSELDLVPFGTLTGPVTRVRLGPREVLLVPFEPALRDVTVTAGDTLEPLQRPWHAPARQAQTRHGDRRIAAQVTRAGTAHLLIQSGRDRGCSVDARLGGLTVLATPAAPAAKAAYPGLQLVALELPTTGPLALNLGRCEALHIDLF